nr:uncharacterized protein LOC111426316 [Onthophagus taurus]
MFKLLALFSTLLFHNLVTATDCRSCYNINEGSCFNPNINLSKSLEFATCSVHSRNLELEMRRVYGSNFEHKTHAVFDVRCVHYEKFYHLTNQTEIYRGCLQKKYAKNFCENQRQNQVYYFYNLTKCNVCSSDLCNSNSSFQLHFNRVFYTITMLLIVYFK